MERPLTKMVKGKNRKISKRKQVLVLNVKIGPVLVATKHSQTLMIKLWNVTGAGTTSASIV